jgi:hypothetical protein
VRKVSSHTCFQFPEREANKRSQYASHSVPLFRLRCIYSGSRHKGTHIEAKCLNMHSICHNTPRMRCTNSRLAVGRLPGVTGARSKQESSVTLGLSFRRRERGWPMPPAAPSTATLKPRCCWVAMVARCRKQDAKIQARTCARQRRRPTPPYPRHPATSPGHSAHALVAMEPLLAARRRRRADTRGHALPRRFMLQGDPPPPSRVGEQPPRGGRRRSRSGAAPACATRLNPRALALTVRLERRGLALRSMRPRILEARGPLLKEVYKTCFFGYVDNTRISVKYV